MANLSSGRPAAAPRVVVIEDDPAILELVLTVLGGEGIPAAGFRDPAEALAAPALARASLVLLDLSLAGPAAEEMLGALRARAQGLAICLLTAAVNADERRQALGADAAIQKPFEIDELLATVRRLLEQ